MNETQAYPGSMRHVSQIPASELRNGLAPDRAAVETVAGSIQRQAKTLESIACRLCGARDQLLGPVPTENAKVDRAPGTLLEQTHANERMLDVIRSQLNEILTQVGI